MELLGTKTIEAVTTFFITVDYKLLLPKQKLCKVNQHFWHFYAIHDT